MALPEGPKTSAFLRNLQLSADPLAYLESVRNQYGDLFTIPFGGTPTVFVSDPEGLRQLFNAREITAPGELNRAAAPATGIHGLLQLDGDRHKQRRKLIMPAFHTARLRPYGQRICELTQQRMSQQPVNQPFALGSILRDMTLQVILEILLGLRSGTHYRSLKRLLPEIDDFGNSFLVELCFAIPALQRDWGRWSPWGRFLALRDRFTQIMDDQINQRRQRPDPSQIDLLSDIVLARDETGEPLNNEEIRDLFPSLLFAGQDAAATAIAWALYWIHKQPTVQDKLLDELDSLGPSPDPLKIGQLPYLSAVCDESLRLYPTQVLTFPRRVEIPFTFMGYHLEPGTILLGNIYLTHHRSDLYPDSKQFKPERFLKRQFATHEFLPFGGGARRCPGEALAVFEMKLIVATILAHYRLTLVDSRPEYPKRRGILFPPANGVKMKLLGQRQPQRQPSYQV